MHHPNCYYIPSHMLAHINVARARGLAEPGPAQQSAKVSEAFRQRRQQAALANLTPTPPPSGPTRVPPSSGGRSHSVTTTKGSSALAPAVAPLGLTIPAPGTHARLIYDDQNQWAFDVLDVRNEDDPAVAGQNVNLAYDALGATLEFYRDVLGRNSIDNLGINLDANVNYGVSFDNAFLGWHSDGVRQWRQRDLPGFHQ